jgi:predicted dehydrogenase
MNIESHISEVDRRGFIKGGTMASLMTMMGGVLLSRAADPVPAAGEPATKKAINPPINCGVIGCGPRGREILQSLARLPNAPVVGVCDHNESAMNRGKKEAPEAKTYSDYKELLANKDIKVVLIATPTHTHKQIVLDALAAGKQIMCEAPLAHTIEDAKEIALAAAKNPKSLFQPGMQLRSDPELINIQNFIEAGAMGKTVKARSQYHKKESWRRGAALPDREKELNWRLDPKLANGLVGELGIHQIDQAMWFFRRKPIAVTGYSSLILWNDGRDVPDTITAIFEYPEGVRMTYEATLANSFDGEYDMFYGSDAAIMIRDRKAWMFKEADSAILGWEVYARKENFYKETGIVLAANATKLVAQGESGKSAFLYDFSSLYYALEAFINNAYKHSKAVEEFIETFGDSDPAALKDYLADAQKNKMPAATVQSAYEANVLSIITNEAIVKNQRIVIDPAQFKLI